MSSRSYPCTLVLAAMLIFKASALSSARAVSVPEGIVPSVLGGSTTKEFDALSSVRPWPEEHKSSLPINLVPGDIPTQCEPSVQTVQVSAGINTDTGSNSASNLPEITTTTTANKSSRLSLARKKVLFVAGMAGFTGFTDIIYMQKYDCFANMVTGNTIRATWALGEGDWSRALFLFGIITTFTAGNTIQRLVDLRMLKNDKNRAEGDALKRMAPLVFACFAMSDILAKVSRGPFHAVFISLGFGMMNAASTQAVGGTVLYAVTGHWMKLGNKLADLLAGKSKKGLKPLKDHLQVISSFFVGLILSVFCYEGIVSYSRILPLQMTVGAVFATLMYWYGNALAPAKSKQL